MTHSHSKHLKMNMCEDMFIPFLPYVNILSKKLNKYGKYFSRITSADTLAGKKQLREVYSSAQSKTNSEDEGINLFSSEAMFKQICSKS